MPQYTRVRNLKYGSSSLAEDPRVVKHFITLYFAEDDILDTEKYEELAFAVRDRYSVALADILLGKENVSREGDPDCSYTDHNVSLKECSDGGMLLQGTFYSRHIWGYKIVEKGFLGSNIAKIFKGDLVLEYGYHSQFNNEFGCYAPSEEIWTQIDFQDPCNTACSVHKGYYNCPLTPIMYENLHLGDLEYDVNYEMP